MDELGPLLPNGRPLIIALIMGLGVVVPLVMVWFGPTFLLTTNSDWDVGTTFFVIWFAGLAVIAVANAWRLYRFVTGKHEDRMP